MRGELIFYVIHIVGTRMIEEGIDGLYRDNNFIGMMRTLNPLQFVPLDKGAVVISSKLEPWISTWWGEMFISLSAKDWFENKGGNLLWDPPPAAAETSLELLLQSIIQRPYKSCVMVVPWIMTFSWIK